RAEGAVVISIPSIEIRPPRSWKPLDAALQNLQDYDWLIFTSVNGVESLFSRLKKISGACISERCSFTDSGKMPGMKGFRRGAAFSRAVRAQNNPGALAPEFHATIARLKIATIGPATRAAIEAHGLRVHVIPKQYVAESVVKALRSKVKEKK